MRLSSRDPSTLGPWPLGVNNLSAEHAVGKGLREALNVDIDDTGRISRREGYSLLAAESEPHSLFGYGRHAYYAVSDTLKMIELFDNGTFGTPMTIFDGLSPDARLAHCMIEPNLYVSDGFLALRVAPDGTVSPWSLPQAPAPAITTASGSTLLAGRYSFSLAYRAATGEEGPLSTATIIELSEGQSATLSFPAAPAGVSRQLIYMTKPNGTAMLLFGSVPSAATMAVVAQERLGRPPAAAGLDPMPPGSFAAYFSGRLLVAAGENLFWSEPQHYAYTALDYNYEMFAEEITGLGVAGETTTGFFVGQETRTYYMRGGNPGDASLEECYPAGIVRGSLTYIPGARLGLDNPPTVPLPAWMATNGVFCVGMPDGSVMPLTESRFAADVGTHGAATFLAREGHNQLLVTTQNPSENNFALRDEVSFEIVRNGLTP